MDENMRKIIIFIDEFEIFKFLFWQLNFEILTLMVEF